MNELRIPIDGGERELVVTKWSQSDTRKTVLQCELEWKIDEFEYEECFDLDPSDPQVEALAWVLFAAVQQAHAKAAS